MEVYLSLRAEKKLQKLIYYLLENWNDKVVSNFLEKLDKKFMQISNFPKSCPFSSKRNIYKCIVSKQTSFYYRLKNNEIEIITFFDNRQDFKNHFCM